MRPVGNISTLIDRQNIIAPIANIIGVASTRQANITNTDAVSSMAGII